jgi:predicted regulator of Ras-like GTPase activity (Roadblock/LC7/MglB family)
MPSEPETDGALPPAVALEELREMSSGVRAALLLDARGELAAAATDPGIERDEKELEKLAHELLEATDRVGDAPGGVEVTAPSGAVFALRAEDWTLVVVAVRDALSSLMFYDLRHAVARLA